MRIGGNLDFIININDCMSIEDFQNKLIIAINQTFDTTCEVLFNATEIDREAEETFVNDILATVDSALNEYSSEFIDVVVEEETNCLRVMYHSDRNSFPLCDSICHKDYVDLQMLEKALDSRNVGHCW